jgi:hypothetical protein
MNVVKGKNIEILKVLDFHGVIFSFSLYFLKKWSYFGHIYVNKENAPHCHQLIFTLLSSEICYKT